MGLPFVRPATKRSVRPVVRALVALAGWMGTGCVEGPPRDPSGEDRAVPAASSASAPGSITAISVTDAVGRGLVFHVPPSRIVSLVPSATATLLALGSGDALVGRTDFDTAQVLMELPSVGGGLGPSMEAIVALEPDLVIRFAGETDPGTPARLDALGIPHFAVRPSRVDDVRRIIRDLGIVTGRQTAAGGILADIDARLADVRARVQGLPPARAAFLLDGTPPWAAGPESYIGELIELGGGLNVFSDLSQEYTPVSPEELVSRAIDVVLTVRGATPGGIPASAVIRQVSAVTQLPGPDLGLAAEEIARALHPQAFR